jgi:hypothetical protein
MLIISVYCSVESPLDRLFHDFGEIKMNAQFKSDTWAGKIYSLGQKVFEQSSNKEIAALVNCANHGIVSRERKAVADKTGWAMPVCRAPATTAQQPKQPQQPQQPAQRQRKQAGSLPAKIQGFLEGTIEDIPDTWEPAHVYPVIDEDSVAWNRFIRRMADIDASMIESFEKWLGRGATLSRQGDFDEVVATASQWDRKAQAQSLAESLIALGYGDKSPAALVREIWA